MNKYSALICVTFNSMFPVSGFLEGFRGGKKQVLKNIAFIVLGLYVVVVMGFVLAVSTLTLYRGLKPVGLQGLVLLQTAFITAGFSFIFGFLNAVSYYIIGSSDESILALPITGRQLFFSRFAMSWISELPFALLVISIGAGIYGWNEGLMLSPIFYIGILAAVITIPALPLCLSYILLILLMNAGRFFRQKSVLLVLSTIITVVVAVVFSVVIQSSFGSMYNMENILQILTSGSLTELIDSAFVFPPAVWFYYAISGASGVLPSLANVTFLLLSGAASVCVTVFLFSGLYVRSLVGFNETVIRRVSDADSYVRQGIRSRSLLFTLYKRDVMTVLREPIFFMNGPFVIILLPLILGITVFANPEVRTALTALHYSGFENVDSFIAIVCAAVACMLGSSTGIGASEFSREGRDFSYMLSLPVRIRTLVSAKFLHTLTYSAIASLMAAAASLMFLGSQRIYYAVAVFAIGVLSSSIIHVIGMWLDTSHPRLDWQNPAAAVKNNLNVFASIMSGLLMTALIALLLFIPFALPLWTVVLILAALFAALWLLYRGYAVRRLAHLDV